MFGSRFEALDPRDLAMDDYVVGAVVVTAGLVYAIVRLSLKTYVISTIEGSIRHQFEVERQTLQQAFESEWRDREHHDKFRLSALEDRMQAHQQAFALARRMQFSVHDTPDSKTKLLEECHDLMDSKMLYLTEDIREAFAKAVNFYGSYHIYHEVWRSNPNEPHAEADLQAAFKAITDLPSIIVKATDREATGDLPYLKDSKDTAFAEQHPKEGVK